MLSQEVPREQIVGITSISMLNNAKRSITALFKHPKLVQSLSAKHSPHTKLRGLTAQHLQTQIPFTDFTACHLHSYLGITSLNPSASSNSIFSSCSILKLLNTAAQAAQTEKTSSSAARVAPYSSVLRTNQMLKTILKTIADQKS